MANIILFSHGQLATGLADSCKLIIGENHFKVLNILLDQNIQEIKNNLDVMIQSFDDNQPVIVVTDIPGGSTTQTAIQRISDNKLLYVVTGMNLGLVMSLSFLSLSQDDEDNKNKIKLKELPVVFSIQIEKGTNLKNIIKNIQKILKKCLHRFKRCVNISEYLVHDSVAQLDRAFDYESKGHRFESCWVHHKNP